MGTSCEIARVRDDGLIDVIHVSYDGYFSGVGLKLFRHYDTPEKVAALFSHDTWAPSLEADPADIDWDEWDPANRGQTVEDFMLTNTYEVPQDELDEAGPGYQGCYIHAHGKWSAPRSKAIAAEFIEKGEGDVITREALMADGVTEAELAAEPERPVTEHVGVLSVELVPDDNEQCILRLKDDRGETYDVFPAQGFQGVEGAPEMEDATGLDGLRVVVRSTSLAVSSSFGPGGSKSTATMGVRSIKVLPAETDAATTA